MRNKNKKGDLFFLFILLCAGFFGFNAKAETIDHLIISEILVGGEKADEEFVEIYNPTENEINFKSTSLKLHIVNSTGKSDVSKTLTFNNESIKARNYVIISSRDYKEKFGENIIIDAFYGSGSLVSKGAVYISRNTKDLTDIIDMVGWGNHEAFYFEKTPFNFNENNNISINRKFDNGTMQDTDDNSEDFIIGIPSPRKDFVPIPEEKPKERVVYSDKIYLNEILPNADEEFIELFNSGENDEDLSGWILRDATKTGKYVFPESSIIKSKDYFVVYKKDYKFALNNTGNESVYLYDPNETLVSSVSYNGGKENVSYNFDGISWRWSKYLTPGAENEFNELTGARIKAERKIYKNTYADFKAKVKNPDNDKLKFTWDFGDGHRSYKKNTRHKYKKTGKYKVTLKIFDGSEETQEEFKVEVKKFPKNKIKIIEISPNPEGRDSEGEYIVVRNESKRKINLKNWAIASGSKKLYNHPISKDIIVKPGKTVKISRDISKFALNNKKAKIELRYPDGKVAYKIKYDKKENVREGETYAKTELGWAWKNNNPETLLAVAKKSADEAIAITGNGGEMTEKNSEDQATVSEEKEKLALSSEANNISPENEKVLGTSVEVKEDNSDDIINKADNHPEKPNVIIKLFENIGSGINSFVNRIILKFF
ncbi:MAG: hypothetical protein A3J63_00315 [Candidatus Moranbacteria bacterium RIFCSPHIGHO2_02_FULL_40_12b]|nr:MAG: hypothetical protein A3J63_00315 [Candidatus Moranbacteria bacterium RIFCSPHIGHO2_02_FULL_40_12b]